MNIAWHAIVTGLVAILMPQMMGGCARAPERRVDFAAAVGVLTNRAAFAVPPKGGAEMASTYDRSGGNCDWAALKADSDGLYTLARLDGPGCLRRIWMTNVPAEEWLFFFDGETSPRFRMAQSALFGGQSPFSPPLCDMISGGSYCYIPFPFRHSLRIAIRSRNITPDGRSYFQLNSEAFGDGVLVESFPPQLTTAARSDIEGVQDAWRKVSDHAVAVAANMQQRTNAVVDPGGVWRWLDDGGAGQITAFRVRPSLSGGGNALQRARVLRELVLRFYWDGAAHPSVDVPIGDFFCNAFQRRKFSSLPLACLDQGYVCLFPMPFGKGVKAEIRNDGSVPISVDVAWSLNRLSSQTAMRFHASWNSAISPGAPYRVLRAEGKGHYVGCYLVSYGMDRTWNILEGDDVMRVDGDDTRTLHGTGLEDYFNSGWYYFGLFDRPLHGLLEKAAMRTAQYRFHLSDAVAFEKSFLMTFEFGDGNRAKGYMSSVAYWYQTEPKPAGTVLLPPERRMLPLDKNGMSAIMAELFELERAGLSVEAEERSRFYSEVFQEPLKSVFALRAAGCRALAGDASELTNTVKQVLGNPALPADVRTQAENLQWLHADSLHAVFGTHGYATARLFLDGKAVGENRNPFQFMAFPVNLTPGEHEIRLEATAPGQQAWVSACLQTHFTNIVTDGTWERLEVNGAEERWMPPNGEQQSMFPEMAWWQFAPNAYAYMQSARQVMHNPAPNWDKPPLRPVTLRKRFTVPEKIGRGALAGGGAEAAVTDAVRQVGDVSNPGLNHGE